MKVGEVEIPNFREGDLVRTHPTYEGKKYPVQTLSYRKGYGYVTNRSMEIDEIGLIITSCVWNPPEFIGYTEILLRDGIHYINPNNIEVVK